MKKKVKRRVLSEHLRWYHENKFSFYMGMGDGYYWCQGGVYEPSCAYGDCPCEYAMGIIERDIRKDYAMLFNKRGAARKLLAD